MDAADTSSKGRWNTTPWRTRQHRLDLVIGMLGQRHGREQNTAVITAHSRIDGTVTCHAGCVLRTFAGGVAGIDVAHAQRHGDVAAQRCAMPLEIVGSRLQPMVHMNRHHLARPPAGTGQQQGRGIGPATERHRQRQLRLEGRDSVRQ